DPLSTGSRGLASMPTLSVTSGREGYALGCLARCHSGPAAKEAAMSEQNRVTALLGDSRLLRAGQADVARVQRRSRFRRIVRALVLLGGLDAFLWYRSSIGHPVGLPHFAADWSLLLPILLLFVLVGALVLMPLANGRSPHVLIRPEEIEIGLDEIKGLDGQADEVVRTLNVFLGYATFRDVLGGNPR